MANQLNISIADATSLWETHQQLLSNNQAYQDEYPNASSPEIGSAAWAAVAEKYFPCDSGTFKLEGFSASDLANFRVIPEDGSAFVTPVNGTTYNCDGFYLNIQPCDPKKYWYKISAGGNVSISKNTDGSWKINTDWNPVCRIIAKAMDKPYAIDWQSDQQKHTTSNPFCP